MKYKSILIFVVFLLVLGSISLAEDFPEIICISDLDCLEQMDLLGPDTFCNLDPNTGMGICVDPEGDLTFPEDEMDPTLFEEETPTENTTTNTTIIEEAKIVSPTLNKQVLELQASLTNIQERINALEIGDSNLQQQLNNINGNLQALSNQLNEFDNVKQELSAVAVGLAGVQDNLNQTNTELGTLESKASRNRILMVIFLVLLIIAVALGLIYYMTGKKGLSQKLDSQTMSYITKHIKSGKKYPEIKSILLKAGWLEKEIKWAYKETIKKNYREYLKNKGPGKVKSAPKHPHYQKKRIMAISGVTALLIVSILIFSNVSTGTSSGKAVHVQKLVGGEVGGEAGEVTYDIECTPPHILNPAADGCCLDVDINSICDFLEQKEATKENLEAGSECNDNYQCSQGNLCIDGQCGKLSELYGSQICENKCDIYGVKAKVIYSSDTEEKVKKECTSDQSCNDYISETEDYCLENSFCVHKPLIEEYVLKPKQGSYTMAGAVEWKVLDVTEYCEGEQAIIPIKIIRKSGRDILTEEIITLKQGETSDLITHPLYESSSFVLKIDKISKPVGC